MENNPTEKTGQTTTEETTDNAIVIETVEDDMRSYGIDVQESNQEEEEEDPETSNDPGQEDEQPKPKKKSRAQRKIERQARLLKEKEEEIERLKNGGQGSSQGDGKEDGDIDPDDIDIDDFDTYAEYREAVRKAEEVAKTKANATDTKGEGGENGESGFSKELDSRIQDMTEDGRDEYENFDEVVKNPDLPLTVPVLEAITQSEQAADIAYYLGGNLERARKLAKMNGRDMAKEILRIEIELEHKPNKVIRVTKAPDPINPVKGGNSSDVKSLDSDNLSFEEHEAILLSKKQKTPGGFL